MRPLNDFSVDEKIAFNKSLSNFNELVPEEVLAKVTSKPKQQPLLYARVGHKVSNPVADAIRVFQRKKGTEIRKNIKFSSN